MNPSNPFPTRKRPAHGVLVLPGQPTIVFLTICTKDRFPWLAAPEVHQRLCANWTEATAWFVGRYLLMPDHLHLFCSSGETPKVLDTWIRYWKRAYSICAGNPVHRWQSGHWDTRLRPGESYTQKWEYVRNNPVRAGLVRFPEDWPYQGEIFPLYP